MINMKKNIVRGEATNFNGNRSVENIIIYGNFLGSELFIDYLLTSTDDLRHMLYYDKCIFLYIIIIIYYHYILLLMHHGVKSL